MMSDLIIKSASLTMYVCAAGTPVVVSPAITYEFPPSICRSCPVSLNTPFSLFLTEARSVIEARLPPMLASLHLDNCSMFALIWLTTFVTFQSSATSVSISQIVLEKWVSGFSYPSKFSPVFENLQMS